MEQTVKQAVDRYLSDGYLLINATDEDGIHQVVLGDYYIPGIGSKRTNDVQRVVIVKQIDGGVTVNEYRR